MKKFVLKTIIGIGAISVVVLGAVLGISKLIKSKKTTVDIKDTDTSVGEVYVNDDLDGIELDGGIDLSVDRENDGDTIEYR